MKIIYGITKSNFGGAQRYVFELSCEMKKRGHDVAVMCSQGGVLVDKLKDKGIRVIEIKELKRDISITPIPWSFHLSTKTPPWLHLTAR